MLLDYENIVIGSSLEAVLYAIVNQYPIFFTEPLAPLRFEYFLPSIDLSFLQIPDSSKILKTLDSEKAVGTPKQTLWELTLFFLGIDGLAPLSNLCSSMRYDGVRIACYNDYSKIADIGFDTCHYFYDPNIAGLVKNINIENQTYICYDYIGFHKGGKHEIDYITTDDDFVSQIWFYSSDRICGNTGVKDACVLSKLTSEQLSDFSYSQTMSKFKALSIMYDNEMKGPLSGYTSKGTPRYSKFKTSLIGREKRLHCPEWVPSLNVRMPEEKEGTLIEMLKEIDLARYSL